MDCEGLLVAEGGGGVVPYIGCNATAPPPPPPARAFALLVAPPVDVAAVVVVDDDFLRLTTHTMTTMTKMMNTNAPAPMMMT